MLNLLFAAIAATMPTCGPAQVTNCRVESANVTLVSVQTPVDTMYFELTNGQLTDLEIYPL